MVKGLKFGQMEQSMLATGLKGSQRDKVYSTIPMEMYMRESLEMDLPMVKEFIIISMDPSMKETLKMI